MILKFYDYLFYHTYLWQLKMWGKYQGPEQWAMIDLMSSFVFIFFSILMVLEMIFGVSPFSFIDDMLYGNKFIFLIGLGGPIFLLHYFLFLYKRRYKKIIKEFSKKEPKGSDPKPNRICWVYALSSCLSFLTIGPLFSFSIRHHFTVVGYIHSFLK